MSLDANQIVELFERDVGARKRLAELMVTEPDVRLAIINAILRDVATKRDVEKLEASTKEAIERLRQELKEEIGKLRQDVDGLKVKMNDLDVRIGRVESSLSLLVKVFFAINAPILLGMIGLLLKYLLFP
ncbi:MAG: hypothetical protein DRO18_05075 [Thermoprotei archaeon]|nr:MAG: hypothetical protein DRO18_05075 [Thermoprotei archaeon]